MSLDKSFDTALLWVLAQEGGFARLKNDEVTNFGVKKSTWQEWVGHSVSDWQLEKLTVADVRPLYKQFFWKPLYADLLWSPLDLCLFDFAVHSGVGAAKFSLSRLLQVGQDQETLVAGANHVHDQRDFINQFCNARAEYLKKLRNYDLYGKGWQARVARLRGHALDMIDHPQRTSAVDAH
jgi:lysozyme family protein